MGILFGAYCLGAYVGIGFVIVAVCFGLWQCVSWFNSINNTCTICGKILDPEKKVRYVDGHGCCKSCARSRGRGDWFANDIR